MISLESVTEFLGWCTIINMSLLTLSTILILLLHQKISRIHAKMFKLQQCDVSRIYFQYLGAYKVASIVFNLVPYIALKIMEK